MKHCIISLHLLLLLSLQAAEKQAIGPEQHLELNIPASAIQKLAEEVSKLSQLAVKTSEYAQQLSNTVSANITYPFTLLLNWPGGQKIITGENHDTFLKNMNHEIQSKNTPEKVLIFLTKEKKHLKKNPRDVYHNEKNFDNLTQNSFPYSKILACAGLLLAASGGTVYYGINNPGRVQDTLYTVNNFFLRLMNK